MTGWFAFPGVKELTSFIGGVDGTRENCDILMSQGAPLLVYPGGLREAWKRTGDEKYTLDAWGDHLGFARMAIKHDYTVVPVSGVGTEDQWKVVYDFPISTVLRGGGAVADPTQGSTTKMLSKDMLLPIFVPAGPCALTQRTYFKFGAPIPTAAYGGAWRDAGAAAHLRDRVRRAVAGGVEALKAHRRADPRRFGALGRAFGKGAAAAPASSKL